MSEKKRAAGYYWITVYGYPQSRQIAEWHPVMRRWAGCGWPIALDDNNVQVVSKRIQRKHTPAAN